MEQPLGLRILAISAGVFGSLAVLAALLLALMGAVILIKNNEALSGWVGTALLVGGILGLLGVLPLVVFAIGAWQGRGWAWWLGLVWFGLAAATGIYNALISFTSPGIRNIPVWIGIALVAGGVVWYLLTPMVRQVFHSAH